MSSGFKQVLLLEMLAKQGIIGGSEAKPKTSNRISKAMPGDNKRWGRENRAKVGYRWLPSLREMAQGARRLSLEG
jgi:hypothetical protein